eukprot:g7334.t1
MASVSNYSELAKLCVDDARSKAEELGEIVEFVSGCWAVCGPVWASGEKNDPNNLWPGKVESALAIGGVFGIETKGSFLFINDFESIGHSIAALHAKGINVPDVCKPRDLKTLYPGPESSSSEEEEQVIACMGAGTGLGVVFLAPGHTEGGYGVFPSEGGMSDTFSPRTEEEWRLKQFLMQLHGDYVEIERVVSGPGLVDVYRFFCKDEAKRIAGLGNVEVDMQGAYVTRMAQDAIRDGIDSDPSVKALDLFLSVYGRALGATAQQFMCFGGLYVAGGILQKVMWRLEQSNVFLNAYTDQGPKMSSIVQKIPLTLIGDDTVGLAGALKVAYLLVMNRQGGGD